MAIVTGPARRFTYIVRITTDIIPAIIMTGITITATIGIMKGHILMAEAHGAIHATNIQ